MSSMKSAVLSVSLYLLQVKCESTMPDWRVATRMSLSIISPESILFRRYPMISFNQRRVSSEENRAPDLSTKMLKIFEAVSSARESTFA